MATDRTQQIHARVNPASWRKFLTLCEKQGVTASEAIGIYIDAVTTGAVDDLKWSDAPDSLSDRLTLVEARLAQLENKTH
jgi:hypothetical protein